MIETVTPEQAGMSASRLADIETTMQGLIDQGKYAGMATLIVRHGQVVQSRCYGKLDLAANKPLQADSLFRIHSLTKPITAVAALMLYDEGRFLLDNPVSKWIPEFKHLRVEHKLADGTIELVAMESEITVRQLLTHTSGLTYDFEFQSLITWDSTVALKFPLSELIQNVARLALVAQPATLWNYSISFDVLGCLIEKLSGQTYDVFLRERLFEPLGMHDTGFFVPADKLERFGPMYRPPSETEGLAVIDDVAGSPFVRPDAAHSGGAGLISTMHDYLRFATMLAHGGELDGVRFLKPSTFTAMTTNQLPGSDFPGSALATGLGYGLGIGVRVTNSLGEGLPAGAFGWGGASGTKAWVYPGQDMIVIGMPQAYMDTGASNILLKMAYEAIVN